jgi:hypothetical protein
MLMVLSSCGDEGRQPPASMKYGDLPVSGNLADARRAGFTACISDDADVRCRREGVFFEQRGPFSAAVDLEGDDGAGGFDRLTLWHQTDQSALIAITDKLRSEGWTECLTPKGSRWADQAVYHQKGSPIFISLDLSYWSVRKLTVYPAVRDNIPQCRAQGEA